MLRSCGNVKRHVRRIECLAKRVGILPKYHVPYIVDQVVLPYLYQSGRGARPLNPDLAVQHGGHALRGRGEVVCVWTKGQCGAASGWQTEVLACRSVDQRLYYIRIGTVDDARAADGGVGGSTGIRPLWRAGRDRCGGRFGRNVVEER